MRIKRDGSGTKPSKKKKSVVATKALTYSISKPSCIIKNCFNSCIISVNSTGQTTEHIKSYKISIDQIYWVDGNR
jgi:hypothetical protein